MACSCDFLCAKVINDIIYDCDCPPVGGICQTIKLINRCDINLTDWTVDRTLSTTDCTHAITAYTGTDPATDFPCVTVSGIPGKRLLSTTFASSNDDFGWRFTHTVNIFSGGLSQDVLCTLKALSAGAEMIAIVEQNFQCGDQATTTNSFLVYGWDTGLKLGDFEYNSNENNGSAIVPLASLEPDLEPFPPMVLDLGGYDATKTFFDSLCTGP